MTVQLHWLRENLLRVGHGVLDECAVSKFSGAAHSLFVPNPLNWPGDSLLFHTVLTVTVMHLTSPQTAC